jgi:predicted phage-related endonuclease
MIGTPHQIHSDLNDQIKKNEMGLVCNTYVVWRDAYRVLVEKTAVKRPLERIKPRWEDNIKLYL